MKASYFGSIDSVLFWSYGITQLFSGSLGDRFNKRKVLSGTFGLQSIIFLVIGFVGMKAS